MATLITALLTLWRNLVCGWTVALAEPAGWEAWRGDSMAAGPGPMRVGMVQNPGQVRTLAPRGTGRAGVPKRANVGLSGVERKRFWGAGHPYDPLALPLCPVG